MYIIPNWPCPENVKAVSTTRVSGFSQRMLNQFNLSDSVNDNPIHLAANLNKLQQDLKLPTKPYWLQQVHGNQVLNTANIIGKPQADATYSKLSNRVCAVMTADCLPILVCDKKGTMVAAIHAGWRGLASGVIEKTIRALACPPGDLLAWFGPAIGPQHFQVGHDVYKAFTQASQQTKAAFKQQDAIHWLADIYHLARLKLNALGVNNIYGGDYCTYSNSELFYSYRRDKGITGRMASLIWLDKRR